jgi:hypothetical protein
MAMWDSLIAVHVRVLLEHLYNLYKAELETFTSNSPRGWKKSSAASTSNSIFMDTIRNVNSSQSQALISELEDFSSGTYPCLDGNTLAWWKVDTLVNQYDLNSQFRNMLLTSQCYPTSPVTFWPFLGLVFLLNNCFQVASTQCLTPDRQ